MYARVGLSTLLLIAIATPAWSQALPEVTPLPELDGSSTTKIPVTMPGGREVLGAESAATSTTSASISLEQPIDPNTYICGPGDTFELNFWGQQNFRLRVAADLEGRVFISKVGFVSVAAKTLAAVRAQVLKKVRAYYPGLNSELSLVAPRSFQVHVVENVKQPGSFKASALERVSSVLGRAGNANGSRRRIEIKRQSGSIIHADLVLYELTGDIVYNPFVLDGDVIRVPFPKVTVTIRGAIRRPGTYELVKANDLHEVIELAGGFASDVTRTLPIRVIRVDDKEHENFIDVPFGSSGAPNHPLQDTDVIEVRGKTEFQRSVLLVGAVAGADTLDPATSSRRLAYVEGDTVMSLISRAGGIKAPGDMHRAYISRPKKNGPPELIALDLEALLIRRDLRADKKVAINDTIVVPPMQYSVLVEGAVSRSGMYPFNPRFGISEYIARAGGRTRTARDMDEVKLIDANGVTRSFSRDLKPAPGDSILVPERNFSRAEVAQLILAGAGLVLSGVAITLAATQ